MSKDKGGVWRTVNGAHVFIKNGQTPEEAFAYHKKIHAMSTKELKEFCVIKLPDEHLSHSVGAKWANYDIEMPDGSIAHFAEGSKIVAKEIIAGYKSHRKIDDIRRLVRQNPGTTGRFWMKLKGVGEIVLADGQQIRAELHWYEHPQIGKIEFKMKDE